MTPLHELLARIRWDPRFGHGEFALGYWDRVLGRIVVVPLAKATIDPGDRFAFQLLDDEGNLHRIPFHRVREVYRDGVRIWKREAGRTP